MIAVCYSIVVVRILMTPYFVRQSIWLSRPPMPILILKFEVWSEQRIWAGSAMDWIFMIHSNRMGLKLTSWRRASFSWGLAALATWTSSGEARFQYSFWPREAPPHGLNYPPQLLPAIREDNRSVTTGHLYSFEIINEGHSHVMQVVLLGVLIASLQEIDFKSYRLNEWRCIGMWLIRKNFDHNLRLGKHAGPIVGIELVTTG